MEVCKNGSMGSGERVPQIRGSVTTDSGGYHRFRRATWIVCTVSEQFRERYHRFGVVQQIQRVLQIRGVLTQRGTTDLRDSVPMFRGTFVKGYHRFRGGVPQVRGRGTGQENSHGASRFLINKFLMILVTGRITEVVRNPGGATDSGGYHRLRRVT